MRTRIVILGQVLACVGLLSACGQPAQDPGPSAGAKASAIDEAMLDGLTGVFTRTDTPGETQEISEIAFGPATFEPDELGVVTGRFEADFVDGTRTDGSYSFDVMSWSGATEITLENADASFWRFYTLEGAGRNKEGTIVRLVLSKMVYSGPGGGGGSKIFTLARAHYEGPKLVTDLRDLSGLTGEYQRTVPAAGTGELTAIKLANPSSASACGGYALVRQGETEEPTVEQGDYTFKAAQAQGEAARLTLSVGDARLEIKALMRNTSGTITRLDLARVDGEQAGQTFTMLRRYPKLPSGIEDALESAAAIDGRFEREGLAPAGEPTALEISASGGTYTATLRQPCDTDVTEQGSFGFAPTDYSTPAYLALQGGAETRSYQIFGIETDASGNAARILMRRRIEEGASATTIEPWFVMTRATTTTATP